VGAYVVFNNAESVQRCLNDYHGSGSMLALGANWLQAPPLRFRGTQRLVVERAPDPSSIIWESIELPWWNRLARRTTVNLLLGALLAASFICIILAQAQQARFRSTVPALSFCNTVLPGIAFNVSVTSAGELAPGAVLPPDPVLVRDYTLSCPQGSDWYSLHWESGDSNKLAVTGRTLSTPNCLNECVKPDTTEKCNMPAYNGETVTYPLSTVVGCYCTAKLRAEISSKGIFTGAQSLVTKEGDLCGTLAVNYVTNQLMTITASLVVVSINTLLKLILQKSACQCAGGRATCLNLVACAASLLPRVCGRHVVFAYRVPRPRCPLRPSPPAVQSQRLRATCRWRASTARRRSRCSWHCC
jgi:hypothetical protein